MTEAEEFAAKVQMKEHFKNSPLQETFVASIHFIAGFERGLQQGKQEAQNDTDSRTKL